MTSFTHAVAGSAISSAEECALYAALDEARKFRGATSPNPPVGAAAIARNGRLVAVAAHEKAGDPHAEVRVLQVCRAHGLLHEISSLVVTLEPCNHTGRTPPCTLALVEAGIGRIVFGASDPNPIARGGESTLRSVGIDVVQAQPGSEVRAACEKLIAPFSHFVRNGTPWVRIKTAHREDGSMLPPAGQRTFTSADSLRFAHELRRRCDAIITGSGTVLADNPSFTVRHVPDFANKRRLLAVLDRRARVPDAWLARAAERSLMARRFTDISECLAFLGEHEVVEALVEAGPTLSQSILDSGFWQEHVMIQCRADMPDLITHVYRNH